MGKLGERLPVRRLRVDVFQRSFGRVANVEVPVVKGGPDDLLDLGAPDLSERGDHRGADAPESVVHGPDQRPDRAGIA